MTIHFLRQSGLVPVCGPAPRRYHQYSDGKDTSYGYSGYQVPTQTVLALPVNPPPPYAMYDSNYLQPNTPAPFYQLPYQSQQYLAPEASKPLRKKASAWASSLDLTRPSTASSGQQEQAWSRTIDTGTRPASSGRADCPIARGMNQGAAFCDRVAARLNDILTQVDGDTGRGDDIEQMARGMSLNEELQVNETSATSLEVEKEAAGGIINFKKTWLYANSRLPPHLPPMIVYMPTWRLLCMAARASVDVYKRPRGAEREHYVDASWKQGTKAMVLKSTPIDDQNLIVLAVRGSQKNWMDWAVNFRPAPKAPVGLLDDEGNACHAGFLQVSLAMIAPVAERLRHLIQENPSRASSSLLITGHSAGGAVASLLYMHMLATRKACESELNILTGCFKRVHCVTFGAPPVSFLPLQKPRSKRHEKSVFMSFANEGDPVVRADKAYIMSLARLIAAPAPVPPKEVITARTIAKKISRQHLKGSRSSKRLSPILRWPVPPATLSNAGRLVLLREKPGKVNQHSIEAVSTTDEQLRDVVFGDPAMHMMALYKRRIDELAVAAVTGGGIG